MCMVLKIYPADRELKDFIYNRGGVDRDTSLYDELYTEKDSNVKMDLNVIGKFLKFFKIFYLFFIFL